MLKTWLNKKTKYAGLALSLPWNKGLELETNYNTNSRHFLYGMFKASRKEDHAGLHAEVEVLGCNVDLRLYDGRHWNPGKNAWYEEGEEEQEWEKDKVVHSELVSFIDAEENVESLREKLKEYLNLVPVSGRADIHEVFFGAVEEEDEK